ncbi:hypothetical protein BDQ94DRAFT_149443 [Aspergillus welwitschiae]|uniref:Uncharacterized protein n=1 Tax=Aspergillus welwitschiae TaxID=1341132 RepID=A0A3F3PT25_9EURO|nr:hypothetical protein BDQ94DRAFT_149443 [Aspergillus welwitschiae]RDH30043.1 hypothetical protein BDQ94DRAFT_149443 [Aspergillus welwitschiae]
MRGKHQHTAPRHPHHRNPPSQEPSKRSPDSPVIHPVPVSPTYLTATRLDPANLRTGDCATQPRTPARPLQAYPIPETPERTSGETGMTSGLSLAKLRRYQRGGAFRG